MYFYQKMLSFLYNILPYNKKVYEIWQKKRYGYTYLRYTYTRTNNKK
jgi:hypothetical protein